MSQLSLELPGALVTLPPLPSPPLPTQLARRSRGSALNPALTPLPCIEQHSLIAGYDMLPLTTIDTPANEAPVQIPPEGADRADDAPIAIHEDRLWQDNGWTARVIKNEDDDGWAVEMLKEGEPEPALVGPWTMGRDKKNPKPLDPSAFNTLVKTATEVLQRHAQQAHAALHKRISVFALDREWDIRLDITPDEYEPYAVLSARDEFGEEVAQVRVRPDFRLTNAAATAWIKDDFRRPERGED